MSQDIVISAVMCTYNRAHLLEKSLNHLCEQTLAPELYEIIVVNNNSTDNTDAVVAAKQAAYPEQTIRLLHEPNQGLSFARNTGWQAAHGKYIAFIDDDSLASSGWLAAILAGFSDWEEDAPASVGGPYLVHYPTEPPIWFKDAYETISFGSHARQLTPNESFAGSNMAFRRDILEAFNGFRTDLGMIGDKLALGEETDLYARMRRGDHVHKLIYLPDASIQSIVPAFKLQLWYQIKRKIVRGMLEAEEFQDEHNVSLQHRLGMCVKYMKRILRKSWAMLEKRNDYEHWQNWLLESSDYMWFDVGYLCRMLGLRLNLRQG